MKNLKTGLLLGCSLILGGCLETDEDSFSNQRGIVCSPEQVDMAIQTVASDYTSSAVAIGCSEGGFLDGNLIKEGSDYTVSAGNESLYHIGRNYIDTVAQYDFLLSDIENWSYSANDANESTSNPYKLIEVSNTKAYLIRYNKSKVWIVNPSALNSEDFKTGELDLSAYLSNTVIQVPTLDNDGNEIFKLDDDDQKIQETDYEGNLVFETVDGQEIAKYEIITEDKSVTATATDMSDALIVNGKLYIAMQRLRNGATGEGQYGPYDIRSYTNDSLVAVFDITTDVELEASPIDENYKAITLSGHNVQSLNVLNDNIYAASQGDYFQDFGLLEVINTTDYSVNTLIQGTEEIGAIKDASVVSATLGYVLTDLSGYVGDVWTPKNKLFPFNPSTGQMDIVMSDFDTIFLTDIEVGPNGYLWVLSSVSSNPGVYKVDSTGSDENLFLETNLNPSKITFKK